MGLGLHVRYPDNLFNWIQCMYIHKILDPTGGVLEVWRRAEISSRDINIEVVRTETRCELWTQSFVWGWVGFYMVWSHLVGLLEFSLNWFGWCMKLKTQKKSTKKNGPVQELRSTFRQFYFCFSHLLSLTLNGKVLFSYGLNFVWSSLVYNSWDWFGS